MPKRALYEKRPYLLASIFAALAFYILRDENFPGFYLILLKGAGVALLAVYAFMRHKSRDAMLVAGAMALAAVGDMTLELDSYLGAIPFFLGHLVALALFLAPHNRRVQPTPSQSALAATLLFGTPLLAYLLSQDFSVAIYGLALGAMAGAAWTSRFSRYHVGIGAVFYIASDLLIFSRLGVFDLGRIPDWLIWPLYYVGQFLICTGVIQTLRRDHQA